MSNVLSQIQFNFMPAEHGQEEHILAASHPEHPFVGQIAWHPKDGEIGGIGVIPALRRQGIATALWHEANRVASQHDLVPPAHAAEHNRTEAGNAWVDSLGRQGAHA